MQRIMLPKYYKSECRFIFGGIFKLKKAFNKSVSEIGRCFFDILSFNIVPGKAIANIDPNQSHPSRNEIVY